MNSILIKKRANIGKPNSEEAFLFIDSENENVLSIVLPNGITKEYYSNPPKIKLIPAVITTNIVINSNEIGLNVTGGYTIDGGSLTVNGNGQISIITI